MNNIHDVGKIDIYRIISDGDGDKITIDLLEFSLQQQEGNGIEEEEADVFSMVIMTLMSAISKKLRKQNDSVIAKLCFMPKIAIIMRQYLWSANCYESLANVFQQNEIDKRIHR